MKYCTFASLSEVELGYSKIQAIRLFQMLIEMLMP